VLNLSLNSEAVGKLSNSSLLKAISFYGFNWRKASVLGWSNERRINYPQWGEVILKTSSEKYEITVCAKSAEALYELAYQSMHSAIGHFLDKKGFHRVHGAAFSSGDKGILLLLDSGQGKSALSFLNVWNKSFGFLGDENPLLRDQTIYPYFSHLAFSPALSSVLGFHDKRICIT
jgi:hypothetical protein